MGAPDVSGSTLEDKETTTTRPPSIPPMGFETMETSTLPSSRPEPITIGPFQAPVLTSLIAPALSSLRTTQRWSDEPFPYAWFLTPVFDFINPDGLVVIAGYQAPGLSPSADTPQAAARKTTALGSVLIGAALLMLLFPSFPTILILRLGGFAILVGSGFLIYYSFPRYIPDFCIGFNCIWVGLILILFQGFGGFILASFIALWITVKGFYRSCCCLSAAAATAIVFSSFFTSSIIGFLLAYDTLLCGIRVYATGKRLSESSLASSA